MATESSKDSTTLCHGCQQAFPSRNAVFVHLKKTAAACLTGEAYRDFIQRVKVPDETVILLYGYRLDDHRSIHNRNNASCSSELLLTGDQVAELLIDTCLQVAASTEQNQKEPIAIQENKNNTSENSARPKYLRSYGNTARKAISDMIAQDEGMAGALTEVLTTKLPPLGAFTLEKWIQQVNAALQQYLSQDPLRVARIILFGRQPFPGKDFNAEMDITHRKVDYLLPAQFLGLSKTEAATLLPPCQHEELDSTSSTKRGLFDPSDPMRIKNADLPPKVLKYMQTLKKAMQQLTTHVVPLDHGDASAVKTKQTNRRKLQRIRNGKTDSILPLEDDNEKDNDTTNKTNIPPKKSCNVLKRKRFHNFTPSVMVHEYMASRRLDRFYHKATFHLNGTPYLLLSLTGDLFLKGQICRVIGLWLAIERGMIDPEIVECVFDDKYPSLVPTPPAPSQGLYAQIAHYTQWEGKAKAILAPRPTDRYPAGWNDETVLRAVYDFGCQMRNSVIASWESNENACDVWVREVLEPWAVSAREHLDRYRQWKNAQTKNTETPVNPAQSQPLTSQTSTVPFQSSLNTKKVPEVYQQVLYHLRRVNDSGQWPTTSMKRQTVIVTKPHTGFSSTSEPQLEGASGSFSVGYMPTTIQQPKANALFPELVKAAFALERALAPYRSPSSTIAINRNSQFRPHVDSGAGAGQSTSLIVGLGDYTGGGLVVEGEEHDIRYNPVEFNGWKQRHWTLPFVGERYSLVWFTPKGCEGMLGIDLEL